VLPVRSDGIGAEATLCHAPLRDAGGAKLAQPSLALEARFRKESGSSMSGSVLSALADFYRQTRDRGGLAPSTSMRSSMQIQPRNVRAVGAEQTSLNRSGLPGRAFFLAAWALGSSSCGSLAEDGSTPPAPGRLSENATAAVDFSSRRAMQRALDGATLPKFVEPLPTFAGQHIDGTRPVTADMQEFRQKILPASFYAGLPAPFRAGTLLWGYALNGKAPNWPAATVEATSGTATEITYSNSLQRADGSPALLQRFLTIDQTIHWADPLNLDASAHCSAGPPYAQACVRPYSGPVPTVPHLHGAEVASAFDGHPDAWFTAGNGPRGPSFISNVYSYVNTQQAATLWFHDHALGATRLNVYSGLAGVYLLRDGRDTGAANNPAALPAGPYEVELLIADRQFDTHGQLLFPDGSPSGLNGDPPNPDLHPRWNPEFFGDVMVVNGKSWPFLDVEPRRYRFRIVNGANARFFELKLQDSGTAQPGPAIWQIGTDGGLLNAPVKLDDPDHVAGPKLLLAPGERADIIVDFSGLSGKSLTLINGANGPFPDGDPADPNTSGQVMQFRVNQRLASLDRTFNPAAPSTSNVSLRQAPIVDIKPSAQRPPDALRQLILVELEGGGGPEMVLLNNSHWDGLRADTGTPVPGSVSNGAINATENPRVGSTEVWEVANLTEDAHPIHLHLVQFQPISRRHFDRDAYRAAWDTQFPGGTFNGVTYAPGEYIPGFGPPRSYTALNEDGALGGNLAFSAFFDQPAAAPDANEQGWKDTLRMNPFEVARIAVRWAPQSVPVDAVHAGQNTFAFNPSTGPGYVWHCHILDHEDNEMMRPYLVAP
jgi:spore coat protein A